MHDPPSARSSPPRTDCGDPADPDYGRVYPWPAALGGAMLTFDRAGRNHALTLFDRRALGETVAIHGRRFEVAAASPGEPGA